MTVYPFVLHLGPLELTGYGLMMMVAFLMAGWAIQIDLRQRGLDEDYAADIIIAGVIGGLIGAKAWYVLLTGETEALFRRGGFVWYGGFIGAVIAILLNGWRRRVPPRFTAEICAAPLALGYALGRVGCFLVNDDYGIPSKLPWAMKFPAGLPPTTVANLQAMNVHFPPGTDPMQVVAVHPTELYETAIMFLVFLWLWKRREHGHAVGWLFACYMVLAGAERFLVEFVRSKDDRILGMFTLAQGTSVLLMIVGGILLYVWRTPTAPQPLPESLRPKEVALRA
ncbi:MAG TPA: prolipoprotein diacylglyceryl transferase [Gemmatimonadales bacterium]|nr:prolipoprotein diacylglyceryl transferase [Gemmatimonadales bacterium]